MDKKILMPLDGSELAEVALPYAEEMAVKVGAGIKLLRVVTLPMYSEPTGGVYTVEQEVALRSCAVKYLEKVGCELRAKGIDVQLDIKCGMAAEEIVEYAASDEISLVVLATHGHSGVTRWALGSVADRVVRGTEKPVVLIRAKGRHPVKPAQQMVKKILVPLDGSRESEAVIPYVAWLASRLKAEVILFQVLVKGYHTLTSSGHEYVIYPEQQMASDKALVKDYLSGIQEILKKEGVTSEVEVRVGHAAEEIIEFTDEVNTDMVAMSTHGRSGVGRWVFGSVAEKVLHEGNKPLLLVRSPGARTQ